MLDRDRTTIALIEWFVESMNCTPTQVFQQLTNEYMGNEGLIPETLCAFHISGYAKALTAPASLPDDSSEVIAGQ